MNGLKNYDWSIRACLVDQQEDGRKHVNKRISRQLNNKYQQLSANCLVYMLSIGQPNKPQLTNHNCETVHTNLEG